MTRHEKRGRTAREGSGLRASERKLGRESKVARGTQQQKAGGKGGYPELPKEEEEEKSRSRNSQKNWEKNY